MVEVEQYQDAPAAGTITGTTSRQIATSAETAIRNGALVTGQPLPTIRALAAELGTSPATVNAAYRILRQRGLVIAAGRRGTRVAPRPALRTPERAAPRPAANLDAGLRDLTVGLPDPELLPPLAPALARIDVKHKLRYSGLEDSDPELLELARERFAADGIPADALSVTSGAFDAIERVLQVHLRPGDRVVIDDPTYIGTRDLLLALGLIVVPVPVDEDGLDPERFAAAVGRGAEAVIVVPRAQNPLGAALSAGRAAELRQVLSAHPDVLLIEDDHTSAIAGTPCETLISPASSRWAVIRSVSKYLHPDLRLAILAGDPTTIAHLEGRQALGPRWVSHLLQALVVELHRDPGFPATIARARETYAVRRRRLIEALAAYGIAAQGRSGLNVWVPVREEAPVVRALREAGWLVQSGERFRIESPPGIRVTIATMREPEPASIAAVIAAAEGTRRARRSY